MDVALPAMHAGCDQGVGRDRRPHPPPYQGDHRPTKEAATLPTPPPESKRRQLQRCCQLCVLRERSMGEIEPSSDDASLSTVLVYRTDGFTHRPLERNQPTAGIKPALAGVLINQSKEPDAGPHVRFCEKHGGVILRAYSTSRQSISPFARPASAITQRAWSIQRVP